MQSYDQNSASVAPLHGLSQPMHTISADILNHASDYAQQSKVDRSTMTAEVTRQSRMITKINDVTTVVDRNKIMVI